MVDKLYKNGVTSSDALHAYISDVAAQDELIRGVLTKCGLARRVSASDRLLYKTWTESWGLPRDVVLYAAERTAGAQSPIAYLNRILADYKQAGITTVEQAQARRTAASQSTATKATIHGENIQRQEYSDEEINALFTALDETED